MAKHPRDQTLTDTAHLSGAELQWFAVWTTDSIRETYRSVAAGSANRFVVWRSDVAKALARSKGLSK